MPTQAVAASQGTQLIAECPGRRPGSRQPRLVQVRQRQAQRSDGTNHGSWVVGLTMGRGSREITRSRGQPASNGRRFRPVLAYTRPSAEVKKRFKKIAAANDKILVPAPRERNSRQRLGSRQSRRAVGLKGQAHFSAVVPTQTTQSSGPKNEPAPGATRYGSPRRAFAEEVCSPPSGCSSLARASRRPIFRKATRAANWALRGRVLPCSQL